MEDNSISKMEQCEVQCPHCQRKQQTEVWSSLNVTHDPELKEKFWARKIKVTECRYCKKQTFIDAPLLYHDMEHRFSVQYLPLSLLDQPDLYDQFDSAGFLEKADIFPGSADYIWKPHIVFDIAEMMRYLLFRYRLIELSNRRCNVPHHPGHSHMAAMGLWDVVSLLTCRREELIWNACPAKPA